MGINIRDCYIKSLQMNYGNIANIVKELLDKAGCPYDSSSFFFLGNSESSLALENIEGENPLLVENIGDESNLDENSIKLISDNIECKFTNAFSKGIEYLKVLNDVYEQNPFYNGEISSQLESLGFNYEVSPECISQGLIPYLGGIKTIGNPLFYLNCIKGYFVDFLSLSDDLVFSNFGIDASYDASDGSTIRINISSPVLYLKKMNMFLNPFPYIEGDNKSRIYDATVMNEQYLLQNQPLFLFFIQSEDIWVKLNPFTTWSVAIMTGNLNFSGQVPYIGASNPAVPFLSNLVVLYQVNYDNNKIEVIGYYVPQRGFFIKEGYKEDLVEILSNNPFVKDFDISKNMLEWFGLNVEMDNNPENPYEEPYEEPSQFNPLVGLNIAGFCPMIKDINGLHYYPLDAMNSDVKYVFSNKRTNFIFSFTTSDMIPINLYFDGEKKIFINRVIPDMSNSTFYKNAVYVLDLDLVKDLEQNNSLNICKITTMTPIYSVVYFDIFPIVFKNIPLFGFPVLGYQPIGSVMINSYLAISPQGLAFISSSLTITSGFMLPSANKNAVVNIVNVASQKEDTEKVNVNILNESSVDLQFADCNIDIQYQEEEVLNKVRVDDIVGISDSIDSLTLLQNGVDSFNDYFKEKFYEAIRNTFLYELSYYTDLENNPSIIDGIMDLYNKFFAWLKLDISNMYVPILAISFSLSMSKEQFSSFREVDLSDINTWVKPNKYLPESFVKLQKLLSSIIKEQEEWSFRVQFILLDGENLEDSPDGESLIRGVVYLIKKKPVFKLQDIVPVELVKKPTKISI